MTPLSFQGIAAAGGGLDISARNFTPLNLQGIAAAGRKHGAKLIIRDARALTALNAQGIAAASPGNVVFVY